MGAQLHPALCDRACRAVAEVRPDDMQFGTVQNDALLIKHAIQKLHAAKSRYYALTAEGYRVQEEREVYRKRAAAVIQGYRTRDAAFRNFRNEKLERHQTLFDLAARNTWLAARAHDYDTGLLGTATGREFLERIIRSRTLGVVRNNGQPQFAGSNNGDPRLSSVLAELKADWEVVRSRLGWKCQLAECP